MNIYKKIISQSAIAAVTLLSSYASQAAMITETLTGFVTDGAFAGTVGTGSFSYESTDITGTGIEVLTGTEFALTFTIFGQTFTNSDDVDAPDYPELTFDFGTAVELDFFVVDLDPTDILEVGVTNLGFFELTPAPGSGSKPGIGFETVVTINEVPVPASFWLFASGIVGLVGVQRRKS